MNNDKVLSIIVKAKDEASRVMSQVGDNMAAVGEKIATAAKYAAAATGAALVAIGVSAVKSTANLEQSMGGSSVVFGKFADQIQKNAKESAKVMGTSTNQYLETANKMGSLFQGAGFSVEKSMELTSSAMQRATDVATAMGISSEMALESIAGAAKGNFTMMDNLGVAMNDTTLNAYALEKGIGKTTQQMTNAEKVGLAMQLFMDKTSKYAGNYARENDTLSGSFQTLKGSWGNFLAGVEGSGEQVAKALAGVASVLGRELPKIMTSLAANVSVLYGEFMRSNPEFQKYVDTVLQLAASVSDYLLPKLLALWDSLQKNIIPIFQDLWHNVIEPLIPVIGELLVAAIGLVVDALKIVFDGIGFVVRGFQEANPVIIGLAGVFGTLAAAMAFNAVFNALTVGFATLQLVTIPALAAQVSWLAGLIATPIVMPAIAVGAALGAIALVWSEYNKMMAAIEGARAAASRDLETTRQQIARNAQMQASGVYSQASKDRSQALTNKFMSMDKANYSQHYMGGPVRAGQPTLVGENRDGSINDTTELFIPGRSGQIVNSKDLQAALGGTGGSTFNMYGNVILKDKNDIDYFFARQSKMNELGAYGAGV